MRKATRAKTPPLSMRAYARHRGVDAAAVLRAIRTGRLKESLVLDRKGKAQIADVELADIEWELNTDLSKAPGYVKERSAAKRSDAPSPLAQASTREKDARAKLAELEYRRKSGELVNAKEVEAAIVDLVTRSRTKLLGVPNKVKSTLPHLAHADVVVIDRAIREALEDLVASGASMTNGAGV